MEKEIENDIDPLNDSINEEILLDEQGDNLIDNEDNIEEFKEKIRKSGVIYISNIPEGMTVNWLREKLQSYGATRIFLTPANLESKSKKRRYKEGWVEFENKLLGKLSEYELNGEPIGGKKNISFREDLWTIKYLHKFKWHHLIEKNNYLKKLREQRMKVEISQARREANFIEDKFEQSKMVERRNKKRIREEKNYNINEIVDNDNEDIKEEKRTIFRRQFVQRKPIFNKK